MTPQFIEDSPASYGQPLIFQSFQTQNSPSQWMHPLPDTTSELHDSLGCLSLSQDDNHLGLRGIDDVQPHQQDFSVPEIPSQQLSLCQRGLTKKKKNSSQGRKAKKPYTSEHPIQAGSAPNVPLPDRIPHPTHSLKQKHSLEEGMYLFRKGSNKRKAVAGFCWLPLEDFSSLDEFLDNFVYHPRRNAGVHKELPKCYCTTGNLISLDGNKQRGFDTRIKRDPNNCYYCLFCDADFTAKHNVYCELFHISSW
ncbi:hypothetical protein BDQ17DRAFT_623903 [Cyathus striatus]|nr:hypothetical protein BDQ17DRAFT_623903 [Cyathus striatus]